MSKKCNQCGFENTDEASACSLCGDTNLQAAADQSTPGESDTFSQPPESPQPTYEPVSTDSGNQAAPSAVITDQAGYQQPTYPQGAAVGAVPPKKSSKGLLIAIIAVVALLIAGVVGYIIFSMSDSPEKKLEKALINMSDIHSMDMNGVMKVEVDGGGMTFGVPINFDLAYDYKDGESLNAYGNVNMNIMDEAVEIFGYVKDNAVYMGLSDGTDTYTFKLFSDVIDLSNQLSDPDSELNAELFAVLKKQGMVTGSFSEYQKDISADRVSNSQAETKKLVQFMNYVGKETQDDDTIYYFDFNLLDYMDDSIKRSTLNGDSFEEYMKDTMDSQLKDTGMTLSSAEQEMIDDLLQQMLEMMKVVPCEFSFTPDNYFKNVKFTVTGEFEIPDVGACSVDLDFKMDYNEINTDTVTIKAVDISSQESTTGLFDDLPAIISDPTALEDQLYEAIYGNDSGGYDIGGTAPNSYGLTWEILNAEGIYTPEDFYEYYGFTLEDVGLDPVTLEELW